MSQIGHFHKEEISFLNQSSVKNITIQLIITSNFPKFSIPFIQSQNVTNYYSRHVKFGSTAISIKKKHLSSKFSRKQKCNSLHIQLIIASRLISPNSQYLLSNPKISEIGHFYKEEIFFFRILSQKYNNSTYHRF